MKGIGIKSGGGMKGVSCSGTETCMLSREVKPSVRRVRTARRLLAFLRDPLPAGLCKGRGLWQRLLSTSRSQIWKHFRVPWEVLGMQIRGEVGDLGSCLTK